MMNEMVMIKDNDGNGEYIAYGYFDESNYFNVTDYDEI